MNKIMAQDKIFDFTMPTMIVGMGRTGLSCARYLAKRACPFAIADSRLEPPSLEEAKKEFAQANIVTGELDIIEFRKYRQFIVSPGISTRTSLFKELKEQDCLIIGDIELFAQVVDKPVIAITGSNGKSTVTTLVEKIANDCGVKAIAGGNLGTPVLDLLETRSELYILELSSFQLETTYSLHTLSATVLNVSEDHMDRYTGLQDYRRVKESIYHNCDNKIINKDEQSTLDSICVVGDNKDQACSFILFGSDEPGENEYGLLKVNHLYTLKKGMHTIIQSNEVKLKGTYNYLNILAALALLQPLQLDENLQITALKEYNGLAHRCEWVDKIAGVQYYNDSKGTNVGATMAAINAFDSSDSGNSVANSTTILIAGGVGKDADFSELGEVIVNKIKATVLLGIDSDSIKSSALKAGARNDSLYTVSSMQEAVLTANKLAEAGDVVLFSPASASFDQYQNYMKRGDDFKEKVLLLKEQLKNVS